MYPPELIAKLEKMGLKADASEAEIKAFMGENNVQWISASKSLETIEQNNENGQQQQNLEAGVNPSLSLTPAPAAGGAAMPVDSKQVAIEAARAEHTRITAINALPNDATDAVTIKATGIKDSLPVDQVELTLLRAARPGTFYINTHQTNVTGEVLEASIRMGSGSAMLAENDYSDEILTAASRAPITSISGFIRAACAMRGVHLPSNPSENDFMQAAASTADIGLVLGNTVGKILLEGYNVYPGLEDVMKLVGIVTVKNFKEQKFVRLYSDGKTSEIGDSGALEHGYLKDAERGISASTKGKLIILTRKQLINDDLGAFLRLPKMMGQDAAKTFVADFWALFVNNSDDFFHADNNNIDETGGVSSETYKTMTKLFRSQKDPNGDPIALSARYIIVSPDEEDTALTLAQSRNMMVVDRKANATISSTKGDVNIYSKYEPIVSPWLSGSTFYGLADPAVMAAFCVAFLKGIRKPTVNNVSNRLPADVLPGAAYTVHFDYGFGKAEHQAATRLGT